MSEPYDDANVFAKILKGQIPSARIAETDDAVAIMDAMPQSRGHCLVIPKAASRNALDADDDALAAAHILAAKLARAVVKAFGADGVTITQFNEETAGQTVFHLHVHVIPRYRGVELERHSGRMADPALLAEQASAIREALA